MSYVSVENRLRPIRFGFLTRPTDIESLQRIFEINTCLWGGKFNPIIPYFERIPKWWHEGETRFESAKEAINGYLDFFEPDIVVEAEAGLASKFGYHVDKIRSLDRFLDATQSNTEDSCGQGMLALYQHLYREQFQFVRRHPHNIISISASASLKKFASCVFGAFPDTHGTEHFSSSFLDVFDPERIDLTPDSFERMLNQKLVSALHLTQSFTEINYNEYSDPTLFLMDLGSSVDLIDYWNLRSFRRLVLPIPIQWAQQLSPFCHSFLRRYYKPLKGNPQGLMARATTIFSRTLPREKTKSAYDNFIRIEHDGANATEFYPTIWRKQPAIMIERQRAIIDAKSSSTNVIVDLEKPDLRFDCLSPSFAESSGTRRRWANVVLIRDWTGRDKLATAYPTDARNPQSPNVAAIDKVSCTTEGFVFLPRFSDLPAHWRLRDGTSAINGWLKSLGVTAKPSDGGIAAQQIIATLGGFNGVRSVANPDVIKILNDLARNPVNKSFPHKKFRDLIAKATKDDIWNDGCFDTLVERRAVELGLRARCTKCNSWSWYPLTNLSYEMKCELCLQSFPFPITDPGKAEKAGWAYRAIGPFALNDYARGGYASALSIRFFAEAIGSSIDRRIAWSSGNELVIDSTPPVETDFIIWHQRTRTLRHDYRTEVIFGEAKSFGKESFDGTDVARMQKIARRFPGAAIVFSTMKDGDDLSEDERKNIRSLALWGRELIEDASESRTPVIVLTGTELFSSFYVSEAWERKGGRHKDLALEYRSDLDRLHILADITQQLYLGLPSYFSWRSERFKKLASRARLRRHEHMH